MAVIGWGKPSIYIKDLDGDKKWMKLPTPIENTTNLATTRGDKQEAKIEGGENEDVKYGKNTYMLELSIRAAKGRKRPISDTDGVVAHNYAVVVQPEDPLVQGFAMEKTTVSVEDNFTSADGGVWAYAFDALLPASSESTDGAKQVQWGVINVAGTDENVTSITLDPEGEDVESFEVAKTTA